MSPVDDTVVTSSFDINRRSAAQIRFKTFVIIEADMRLKLYEKILKRRSGDQTINHNAYARDGGQVGGHGAELALDWIRRGSVAENKDQRPALCQSVFAAKILL